MSSEDSNITGRDLSRSSSTSDNGANNSPNGQLQESESPKESGSFENLSEVQKILHRLGSAGSHRSINLSFVEMEGNEAQMIGESIASSQYLEELILQLDSVLLQDEEDEEDENHSGQNDIILSTAFLGPRPNTSVRTLIIAGSGTDGDLMRVGVLPRVICENSHLTTLEFRWHGDDGTSQDETRELFDSLLQNSSLRTLVLPSLVRWDFGNSSDGGFIDAKTFSQVVQLVEENSSITHLDIEIGECRGPGSEVLNLPAFYIALRSNSTLKTLCLRSCIMTRDAQREFLEWIETTDTLEELHLGPFDDSFEDDGENVSLRYDLFFRSLRVNRSLKKLKLDGTSVEGEENFTELMDAIKVNLNLQEIMFDPENGHGEAVREALRSRVGRER